MPSPGPLKDLVFHFFGREPSATFNISTAEASPRRAATCLLLPPIHTWESPVLLSQKWRAEISPWKPIVHVNLV